VLLVEGKKVFIGAKDIIDSIYLLPFPRQQTFNKLLQISALAEMESIHQVMKVYLSLNNGRHDPKIVNL